MGGQSKRPDHAAGRPHNAKPAATTGRGRWLATHGRDLKFLVLFALFLGLFFGVASFPIFQRAVFPGYLKLNADASAAILRFFGEKVSVQDKTVTLTKGGAPYAITIERGCDAIQPSALFCAAVLASPVALMPRISAVLAGTTLLMMLNFVRILSLCYIRGYWPSAFEVMHLDVWQALFILFAIVLWGLWASWQAHRTPAVAHAPTESHS